MHILFHLVRKSLPKNFVWSISARSMCWRWLTATIIPSFSTISVIMIDLKPCLSLPRSVSCSGYLKYGWVQRCTKCRFIFNYYFLKVLFNAVQWFTIFFANRQTEMTLTWFFGEKFKSGSSTKSSAWSIWSGWLSTTTIPNFSSTTTKLNKLVIFVFVVKISFGGHFKSSSL